METTKIEAILDHLCQNIGGDWLLVGGALVQLHINAERATEDIDLAFISHSKKTLNLAQNELFQYSMQNLNIGPESVNLAVDFFLNEISDWRENCVLIQSGTQGRIFRPNLSLFVALKMRRASTIDINDIKEAMKLFPRPEFDEHKIAKWLNDERFELFKKVIQ